MDIDKEKYFEFVEPYIPLDKSWAIRIGVQDLLHGDVDNTISQLENNQPLCDDLSVFKNILENWEETNLINVGESGTLYRFFKYINWNYDLDKEFIVEGTLIDRKITDDPNVIFLKQKSLLQLDNQTSQWASASVLCGDETRLIDPPFKLGLTYEAWGAWHTGEGNRHLIKDSTLRNQALTFMHLKEGSRPEFEAEQAEDYPFALTFEYLTVDEGLERWPSLVGHESNRIIEMSKMLDNAKNGQEVSSKDHRIVQALGMWGLVNQVDIKFTNPNSVSKSWPKYWEFISAADLPRV